MHICSKSRTDGENKLTAAQVIWHLKVFLKKNVKWFTCFKFLFNVIFGKLLSEKEKLLEKFIIYMVNIFQEEYKEKSGQNNGTKLSKKYQNNTFP